MEPEWLKKARAEGRVTEGKTVNIPKGELFGPTSSIPGEAMAKLLKGCSEKQFQELVIAYAKQHGWRVAHFEKVPIAHGKRVTWATPVKADGAGFPDLELVRERLIKAELKVGANRTTPEQDAWLCAYATAGVEWYIWRPEDWNSIQAVLSQRKG